MKGWALAFMNKNEKALMSDLGTLIGGVAGGFSASKLGLTDLIPVLRGASPAPEWLLKTARVIHPLVTSPFGRTFIRDNIERYMAKGGHNPEVLLSLLKKIAPVVDLQVSDDADPVDQLIVNLEVLAIRILEHSSDNRPTAFVVCPNCKFAHIV